MTAYIAPDFSVPFPSLPNGNRLNNTLNENPGVGPSSPLHAPVLNNCQILKLCGGRLSLAVPYALRRGTELILEGGLLITNKLQPTLPGQSLGSLTLTVSSVIDLCSGPGGSILKFSKLAGFNVSQMLIINNWCGHPQGNGRDQLLFTDASNLTPDILRHIHFIGHPAGARLLENNEIVPQQIA